MIMTPTEVNSAPTASKDSKPTTGALVLLVWTIVACMLPNVWLSVTERMGLWPTLANLLMPLGVYTLLMSLTPKVGKASLWMVILFVFAAFQVVLLYMYGRSIIAVDMFLNVATTNPGEVAELLGNMLLIMVAIVAVYVPPIVMAISGCVKGWRLPKAVMAFTRKSGFVYFGLGALFFCASFFVSRPFRPHCDIYPANIFYNLYLAGQRTVRMARYDATSAPFRHHAVATHPDSVPEIYVVVVGETSRADNWHNAGYDRPTTTALDSVKRLVSFPRAISQSNTTHKSVPMLLSHLDAKTFGDSIYYVKSLISAFKEAGFHTAFYSAQSRNHSFIDSFGEEADTCFFIKEDGENRAHYYDTDLMPYLEREIGSGRRKQLVVLHTYGSHFNYIDRYPQSEAVFLPDRPAEATYHFRPKQINAYDNTIVFTAGFLRGIIDRLSDAGIAAAMIYTSDHGEDIFDDSRRLFLHASPIPSYYQIHVPFLVWTSPAYDALNPSAAENLRENEDKFVASSRAFFHTVVELAGLSTPYFKPAYSLANRVYTPEVPIYLNDHNESVALKDCGILPLDTCQLRRLGVPGF